MAMSTDSKEAKRGPTTCMRALMGRGYIWRTTSSIMRRVCMPVLMAHLGPRQVLKRHSLPPKAFSLEIEGLRRQL